jgi:hypothetical protein
MRVKALTMLYLQGDAKLHAVFPVHLVQAYRQNPPRIKILNLRVPSHTERPQLRERSPPKIPVFYNLAYSEGIASMIDILVILRRARLDECELLD